MQPAVAGCIFFLIMKELFGKTDKKTALLIICVLIVFFILMVTGYYDCPLRLLFGIPCPFCGMTRAFMALLHGDIAMSFHYHPLWPGVIILGILFVLVQFKVIRPSKRTSDTVLLFFSALLLICFIWRHLNGSEVVQIDPESSIVYKLIDLFVL